MEEGALLDSSGLDSADLPDAVLAVTALLLSLYPVETVEGLLLPGSLISLAYRASPSLRDSGRE